MRVQHLFCSNDLDTFGRFSNSSSCKNDSPSKEAHTVPGSLLVRMFVLLSVLCIVLGVSVVKAADKEPHPDYPNWFLDNSILELQDDLEEAVSEGKKGLMVLYTTQGCSYCAAFIRKSLNNPEIAAQVQKDFIAVGLEIFDDGEMVDPKGVETTIKEFAESEGAGFAPTLLFYDENGKRVLRQIGYQAPERFVQLLDYVANQHYASQSLKSFIEKKIPSTSTYTLKADPLFDQQPYALDRSHFAAQEPLLVIFEKNGCLECDTFHKDVLDSQEVRDTLKKFQVIRLDASDDKTPVVLPDGKKSTSSKWYQQTTFSRYPAIMLFNESGKEVLRTDAEVGHGRMMNSLNFTLEKAYEKNWTYQRFARSKAIARSLKKAGSEQQQ